MDINRHLAAGELGASLGEPGGSGLAFSSGESGVSLGGLRSDWIS